MLARSRSYYTLQMMERTGRLEDSHAISDRLQAVEAALTSVQDSVQALVAASNKRSESSPPVLRCDMCTQVTPLAAAAKGVQYSKSTTPEATSLPKRLTEDEQNDTPFTSADHAAALPNLLNQHAQAQRLTTWHMQRKANQTPQQTHRNVSEQQSSNGAPPAPAGKAAQVPMCQASEARLRRSLRHGQPTAANNVGVKRGNARKRKQVHIVPSHPCLYLSTATKRLVCCAQAVQK